MADGVVMGVMILAHRDLTLRANDDITIGLADGTSVPATLVGRDLSTDLALLRVQSSSLLCEKRW